MSSPTAPSSCVAAMACPAVRCARRPTAGTPLSTRAPPATRFASRPTLPPPPPLSSEPPDSRGSPATSPPSMALSCRSSPLRRPPQTPRLPASAGRGHRPARDAPQAPDGARPSGNSDDEQTHDADPRRRRSDGHRHRLRAGQLTRRMARPRHGGAFETPDDAVAVCRPDPAFLPELRAQGAFQAPSA